jgi:hypothetical protein
MAPLPAPLKLAEVGAANLITRMGPTRQTPAIMVATTDLMAGLMMEAETAAEVEMGAVETEAAEAANPIPELVVQRYHRIRAGADGSNMEQAPVMVGHRHDGAHTVDGMSRPSHVPAAMLGGGLLRVWFANGGG